MIRIVEIDLARAEKHEHPDIKPDSYYLAVIDGRPYFGRFRRVWFGWSFADGFGASGSHQFDAPGYNYSRWEQLYEVQGLRLATPRKLRTTTTQAVRKSHWLPQRSCRRGAR